MDQEDNTKFYQNEIERQNIKEKAYYHQDTGKQNNMKIFMIVIMIINILQTLYNWFVYYYLFWIFSFNYYYNNGFIFLGLLLYPIMIIIFKCFQKSTIFKKLSILTFLLFFTSFGLFSFELFEIFDAFHQSKEGTIFFYIAIIDLLVAYLLNIIYIRFTNYLIERNFQIIQYIVTIIVMIIYIICGVYGIVDINFQLIVSIIYFQGIMTLYLLIQLQLLFETLNVSYKLSLNEFLFRYMQIQTRIFLFCFKD